MDAILLVFWLQMHIVAALNLWGDIVASIVFWLFRKISSCRKAKLLLTSKLRLI